jgi:hypothetical protein
MPMLLVYISNGWRGLRFFIPAVSKKPHLDIAEGDGSGKNTRLLPTLQSAAVNNQN